MKIFTLSTTILVLSTLFIVSLTSDISKLNKRLPRFISFDHKGGQIDVDLDLSIPFISIPLNNEEHQTAGDQPKSLLNINVKSLTFAALLATITAFIVPFFSKPSYEHHNYRLDNEFGFQEAGQAVKELILGNDYVTPCLQQAVCSAVMKTKKNKITTSTEKIIDGISNSRWFTSMMNGTAIEEAIDAAHQPNTQCNRIFNKCKMSADVFQAVMEELGIY